MTKCHVFVGWVGGTTDGRVYHQQKKYIGKVQIVPTVTDRLRKCETLQIMKTLKIMNIFYYYRLIVD